MRRVMLALMMVAVVVAMVAAAGPAMAQTDKRAIKQANRAAKQANRAAEKPNNQALQVEKAAPGDAGAQKKALPSSGGVPVGSLALMGAGTLIVGGGLLVRRRSARR